MILRTRPWGGDRLRVDKSVDVFDPIPVGAEEREDFDEDDYFRIETESRRFAVFQSPEDREGRYISQDGKDAFSPFWDRPWAECFIEQPSPVPWEQGMIIRAGLDEMILSQFTKRELRFLLSDSDGSTLLKPSNVCGFWELSEHKELLVSSGRYSTAEIEHKVVKVELSEVTEGHVIAAPIWFTTWLASKTQVLIHEPPDDLAEAWKRRWKPMTDIEKTLSLVNYATYFGGQNGTPIKVDSSAPISS